MSKKEYKVLHPISHGGRVERGEVVTLTDEEATTKLALGLIAPVVAEEKESEEAEVEVSAMTLTQLRAKAKELGLDASGSKADLLERVTLALGGSEE